MSTKSTQVAVRTKGPILKRFAAVLLRTPRYALLVANLARDERLSRGQRIGAVASLGYCLSPIDLVPGIIPILGQLDDLAVLIGGLKLVLRTIPPAIGIDHLQRVGLSARDVDEDLATVGDTAQWIGRQGASRARGLLSSARSAMGIR